MIGLACLKITTTAKWLVEDKAIHSRKLVTDITAVDGQISKCGFQVYDSCLR